MRNCKKYISEYDVYKDIPINISVEVGNKIVTLSSLAQMSVGSVIGLDALAGEHMSILANNKKIGEGELVVINEHYGVRITRLEKESDYLSCVPEIEKTE